MTQYIYGNNLKLTSRSSNEVTITSNKGLNIVKSKAGLYSTGTPSAGSLVANTWTKITATTLPLQLQDFTHDDNKLIYTGTNSVNLLVNYSISIIGSAAVFFDFGISINDEDPLTTDFTGGTLATAAYRVFNVNTNVTLENGDYISAYVRNINTTDGYTVYLFNITAIQI